MDINNVQIGKQIYYYLTNEDGSKVRKMAIIEEEIPFANDEEGFPIYAAVDEDGRLMALRIEEMYEGQ